MARVTSDAFPVDNAIDAIKSLRRETPRSLKHVHFLIGLIVGTELFAAPLLAALAIWAGFSPIHYPRTALAIVAAGGVLGGWAAIYVIPKLLPRPSIPMELWFRRADVTRRTWTRTLHKQC